MNLIRMAPTLKSMALVAGICAAIFLVTAGVALAQTTTGTTTTTTPGVPSTGEGGDATTNLIILGIAGLAIIAAVVYLVGRWGSAASSES